MLIQRETPAHADEIRAVVDAAFGKVGSVESVLVDELREDAGWLPRLSFVAVEDGRVTGHVVCSRAHVDGAPALGLGPLAVHPDRQRRGTGLALVHTVLGAADALGEPLVVLLGDPGYYARFGFRLAAEFGVTPPVAEWAPHFQARPLSAFTPGLRGRFRYAEPFDRV